MERKLTDFINSSAQENKVLICEERERVTRADERPAEGKEGG
ncbi:hypothetical protein [Thermococcus sp. JdF3]|nr:hypothetical protein [Thermococcus sp. JdF3]